MSRRLSIASYSSIASSLESPVPYVADDEYTPLLPDPDPVHPYVETNFWQIFTSDYVVYNDRDEARDHVCIPNTTDFFPPLPPCTNF